MVVLCITHWFAKAQIKHPDIILQNEKIVTAFYKQQTHIPFWLRSDSTIALKQRLIQTISDSAARQGLDKDKYLSRLPLRNLKTKSDSLKYDFIITDVACDYFKDLCMGKDIKQQISSDEISEYCISIEQENLLNALSGIAMPDQLSSSINKLEPSLPAYVLLKKELARNLDAGDIRKIYQ